VSPFLFREAFRYFTRSKRLNLISLGSISMALMALGIVAAIEIGIYRLTQFVEAKVEIVVFLNDRIEAPVQEAFLEKLRNHPQVTGVEYRSREDALAEFGRDPELRRFLEVLGGNPLPASVRVQLAEKTPENVERFAAWVRAQPGVDEIAYGGTDANRLLKALALVRLAVLILTISLMAAAVIIIGNIISLMVFAHREEISILRIIGATPWFIRGPFLIWGMVQGMASGLLASLLLFLIWQILAHYSWQDMGLNLNAWLPPWASQAALLATGGLVVAGALLGLAGSLVSVGRELRE